MTYECGGGYKNLIIADRGFAAYNFFAHAIEKGVYFMVRAKDDNTEYMIGKRLDELPDKFDMTVHRILTKSKSVETSFCTLKHTLGATTLHSKKYEYILQEIWARMVLYNFCAEIIKCTRVKKSGKRLKYKINVSQAMKICRQFLKNIIKGDIRKLIEKFILPIRNNRIFKRRKRTSIAVCLNYR